MTDRMLDLHAAVAKDLYLQMAAAGIEMQEAAENSKRGADRLLATYGWRVTSVTAEPIK